MSQAWLRYVPLIFIPAQQGDPPCPGQASLRALLPAQGHSIGLKASVPQERGPSSRRSLPLTEGTHA